MCQIARLSSECASPTGTNPCSMAKVFLDFAALTNSTTMARQRRRMTAAQEAVIQALASPRRNQDTTSGKVRLSP